MIIGAVAILFLRQANVTSFGHAGQDVGHGLTGISTGISNLFGSVINPVLGLFGSLTSLFNLGEAPNQSENTYGYVRTVPTENTSRQNSAIATQNTVNQESHATTATTTSTGGYVNAVGVASWLR